MNTLEELRVNDLIDIDPSTSKYYIIECIHKCDECILQKDIKGLNVKDNESICHARYKYLLKRKKLDKIKEIMK